MHGLMLVMCNQTIDRVDKQYSSLKYYLGMGSRSFDTLIKRAHTQTTIQ